MRADGCLTMANHSCCLSVLVRLDKAFKSFFARVKRGDKPGFPRFRSFRRYDSLTYLEYGKGAKIMPTGKLRIQGAGHIKMKMHRPIKGRIKTTTIKREAGRWFTSFVVEFTPTPLPENLDAIGIDVGLSSFATMSDGTEIANPGFFKNGQAKLRIAGRRVSRRKKGSNRRRKAVLLLQRAHAHVAAQRSDFHHKLSRQLVNQFGLIVVEDLNVKGLAGGMLAKAVSDVGWSQFFRMTEYKAEWAGRRFVKVDPRGTSQTCICGERVPKKLSDRWHLCPKCEASMSRDEMSAQIILSRAGNQPSVANVEVVNSCVGREAVNI